MFLKTSMDLAKQITTVVNQLTLNTTLECQRQFCTVVAF